MPKGYTEGLVLMSALGWGKFRKYVENLSKVGSLVWAPLLPSGRGTTDQQRIMLFYNLPYLNFRQDDTFLIRLVEASDKSSKSAQPGVRKK